MKGRTSAALLLVLACRADPIPTAAVYPAGTPFATRDLVVAATRLRVIDTGRGPAVVFIHGFAASLYSWRHQLKPVLDAGYRVLAFDNRGFGFSAHPDSGYTNAAYAALLVGLLDSLQISEAVLVGHSMGGAVAAEVALAYPGRVRGLVLIDPAGYGPISARVIHRPLLRQIAVSLVSRATTAVCLRLLFADGRRVAAADVDQYYAPLAGGSARASLRRVLSAFDFEGLRGRTAGIQVATLVLWGEADPLIPFRSAADLAADLPRAAFVLVRDAGHNPQEEQPDEVNRALMAYLRSGLPAVPPDLAAGHSSAAKHSTAARSHGD